MNFDQYQAAARFMSRGALGSFAAHIGDAYLSADAGNRERLRRSFAALFLRAYNFTLLPLEA